MTRVDFYQIENEEPQLMFACRLIDKVYRLGHRIYVHTATAGDAESLDDLLWSFREDRFIPHACTATGEEAPVLIGHDTEPADHDEVLINLSGAVPDFFSRFERVAEIVPFDADSRDAARQNFRFYKDRGYPLEYHAMG